MTAELFTAVVTALLTASVTLLAVWLTNHGNTSRLLMQLAHERDEQRAILHREKRDELYILAAKYWTSLIANYLPYVSVMKGEIDYNAALDMTIENSGKGGNDFDRLQMLIDIYFPRIANELDAVLQARDKVNDIMAEHKAGYKRGDLNGKRFVDPMMEAIQLVNDKCERLKHKIKQLNQSEAG